MGVKHARGHDGKRVRSTTKGVVLCVFGRQRRPPRTRNDVSGRATEPTNPRFPCSTDRHPRRRRRRRRRQTQSLVFFFFAFSPSSCCVVFFSFTLRLLVLSISFSPKSLYVCLSFPLTLYIAWRAREWWIIFLVVHQEKSRGGAAVDVPLALLLLSFFFFFFFIFFLVLLRLLLLLLLLLLVLWRHQSVVKWFLQKEGKIILVSEFVSLADGAGRHQLVDDLNTSSTYLCIDQRLERTEEKTNQTNKKRRKNQQEEAKKKRVH